MKKSVFRNNLLCSDRCAPCGSHAFKTFAQSGRSVLGKSGRLFLAHGPLRGCGHICHPCRPVAIGTQRREEDYLDGSAHPTSLHCKTLLSVHASCGPSKSGSASGVLVSRNSKKCSRESIKHCTDTRCNLIRVRLGFNPFPTRRNECPKSVADQWLGREQASAKKVARPKARHSFFKLPEMRYNTGGLTAFSFSSE